MNLKKLFDRIEAMRQYQKEHELTGSPVAKAKADREAKIVDAEIVWFRYREKLRK